MNKCFVFVGIVLIYVSMQSVSSGQPIKLRPAIIDPSKALLFWGVDTTNLNLIRSSVNSSNWDISSEASLFLAEHGYTDAIPIIKSKCDSAMQILIPGDSLSHTCIPMGYLPALFFLHYPGATSMTKSFIDAVLSTKDLRIKPWYLGDVWNAIQLLAYEGDYSQFNNLKMLVELDLQDTTQYWENYHVRKLCGTDFALLTAYGEKSEYRMSVFNLLREFASHPKLDCREKAEYYLSTFLRDIPETHEVIKQIAVSDPDFDLKRNAMNSLWHLFHDASAISIIEDIILTTNDSTQMEACISDLSTFDSPYAYAALLSSYEQRYQDPLGNFIKEKVDHYRAPPLLPDVPLTVAIDSLRAYTIECQNLQWIGGREFVNELTNHLGDARKHLAGKDSLNSSREIEKYQSQINKEYREGNNRDNRFVTAAGWKYLYMEAGYVIARLIQLPRKHYAPLLEQIDSLKSELKHQEGLKNVSGLLLTKSLELFVDQAGKRFQRRDSTGTALNLKLFQLLVDQTNELTDELKTKKLTTYVNDQAYVQLFYRAKYILEDLPQPRESIALPGRIDKELQQKLEKMKSEVRTD